MFRDMTPKELRLMQQLLNTTVLCESYFEAKARIASIENPDIAPARSKILDRLRVQRQVLDIVLAEYRDEMGG